MEPRPIIRQVTPERAKEHIEQSPILGTDTDIKDEVLLEYKGWVGDWFLPVSLITYKDGTMDLHSQTGETHETAIEAARHILWRRKLAVGPADSLFGSGMYYPVKPYHEPAQVSWDPPV